MQFQNISKIWHLWVKPTSVSKHPTNPELDNLKSELVWYLPTVLSLFKRITIGQIKWFFHHQWKKVLIQTLTVILIIFSSYYLVVYVKEIMNKDNTKIVNKETVIFRADLKSWEQFNYDVGKKESSNKWYIINNYGMLGYYQFSPNTLKDYIGFNISKEDFLSDSTLQKCAFKIFIKKNKQTYANIINKWHMKHIKNVRGTVTESGILMAFHLRPESAMLFFNSNGENLGKPDANGVYVNYYVELFNGYNIPF